MNTHLLDEISKLNIDDRILLIETIWESINNEPEIIEAIAHHQPVMKKRIESFRKNRKNVSDWQTAKERIIDKL